MQLLFKAAAIAFCCGLFCPLATAQLKLTRAEEELRGPVRTVETIQSSIQLDYTKTKYIETGGVPKTVSFDRQGRKTEEYSGPPRGDSSNGKQIFVYDAQGRLQEIVEYDHEGKVESRFTAAHDDQGRIIALNGWGRIQPGLFSSANPKPFQVKASFVYTSTGRIVEYLLGDLDGEEALILFKTVSTFRQDGKLINEKFFVVNALESEQTYIYDTKGRLSETTRVEPRGRSSVQEFYTNDERGNSLEVRKLRKHGSKRDLESRGVFVYEYDSFGNWVKLFASSWSFSGTPYREGVSKLIPTGVTRRVITYYE